MRSYAEGRHLNADEAPSHGFTGLLIPGQCGNFFVVRRPARLWQSSHPRRFAAQNKELNMKKFAMIAAALICFAGCAQSGTDEYGATDTTVITNETAVGTPAATQSGIDSSMQDTNSVWDTNQGSSTLSADTNQLGGSSTLSADTNNLGQSGSLQSGSQPSTPQPPSPDQQQGTQP